MNLILTSQKGNEAKASAEFKEIALQHGLRKLHIEKSDFDGVLDYLEVGGLPSTVVPYIVAASRNLRENPLTLAYLDAIRSRVASVVEIPDEANAVRLAGMSGVPAERLSSRLRLAYRDLTEAVAVMPRAGGSRG